MIMASMAAFPSLSNFAILIWVLPSVCLFEGGRSREGNVNLLSGGGRRYFRISHRQTGCDDVLLWL